MPEVRPGVETGGPTPLVRIEGVLVKLECANPSGSIKDRIAGFLLAEARRRGELRPGDTVVETTSGNTGIALARVARQLGHRVIIFMPEHMSHERRRLLEALGAEVRLTPRGEGFAGAVAERDRFKGRPGHYVPDQFGNPDNTRCHRLTTGAELLRQAGELGVAGIDAFVAGVGTGGTLMGIGAALRERFPRARLIAVEPDEAAVMSGERGDGEHGIQGIGDGFIPELVEMRAIDSVARVGTAEAKAEALRLHGEHGHCVGISSGANHLVARRLAASGLTVATVWPDRSDRYVSLGLAAPGTARRGCPLQRDCLERMRQLVA